jgi:hypothetical protein
MGYGFVILIHLVAIFLLSATIALVWTVLTRLLAKEEKRKRKILFAGIAPFVGLYTLYFLGLFGSIIISQIKGVDEGIGDYWYVPIKNNCKLTFIDLPEQSYLDDDNKTVIESIEFIQQTDKSVLGKTYDSIYFSYNLKTKDLQKYKTENDFVISNNNQKPNFKTTTDFYNDKRNELAGTSFIIVGVISLMTTIFVIWILRKIILGQFK